MKKQIVIILLLAVLAGTSVFGQAVPGSAPRGVNCTNDALHPIAGREYTYQAASGQTGNYTFWATKDANFITTNGSGVTSTNIGTKLTDGTDLLSVSTNYAVPSATDNVKITWSDAILAATTTASPTFVAVNKDGSCANNFKVWAITPIKAFTVDIQNMANSTTPAGFDTPTSQCFDQVRGAIYDAGSQKMQYDYGTNILYFEVIAANFTGSWVPTFNLTGLGNGQTAVIEWAYDKAFTTPITCTTGVASATPVATTETVTSNGVSIYVRVTVTNHTYEGIAATPISLAVDGVNSVNDWDIENNNGTTAGNLCQPGTLNDNLDVAIQTLNPRPDVSTANPATPLVPGNETH